MMGEQQDRWTELERIAAAGRDLDRTSAGWPEKYGCMRVADGHIVEIAHGVPAGVRWMGFRGCGCWSASVYLLERKAFSRKVPAELDAELREWAERHGVEVLL